MADPVPINPHFGHDPERLRKVRVLPERHRVAPGSWAVVPASARRNGLFWAFVLGTAGFLFIPQLNHPDGAAHPVPSIQKIWTVQVGAFRHREQAEAHAREITASTGETPRVIKDGGWFITTLGEYNTFDEAVSAAKNLKEKRVETWIRTAPALEKMQ